MICNKISQQNKITFQRKFTSKEVEEIKNFNANTHNTSLVYIRTKKIRAKDGAIGQLQKILQENPCHDWAKALIKELKYFAKNPSVLKQCSKKGR